MNEAKFQLGRRLFYDQRMSINGKGSCSTCHLQEYGFANQKTVAEGVTGEKHSRRAMSLANVAYFTAFNWANPTVKNLEQQARTPLFGQHPVELGLPEDGAPFLKVIASDPLYQSLLLATFPGDLGPYTSDHLTKAIACFERALISGRSRYDRYRYQGQENAISESAKRGEDLFFLCAYEMFPLPPELHVWRQHRILNHSRSQPRILKHGPLQSQRESFLAARQFRTLRVHPRSRGHRQI